MCGAALELVTTREWHGREKFPSTATSTFDNCILCAARVPEPVSGVAEQKFRRIRKHPPETGPKNRPENRVNTPPEGSRDSFRHAGCGTRRLSIASARASLAIPRDDRARYARLWLPKSAASRE